MADGPKILVLDIETSPNLAYVWGLFKENIGLSQLKETGQVISFAYRWHGTKKVGFESIFDFEVGEITASARGLMIHTAYELMSEADVIVHWNGTSFDVPHLNRELLLEGYPPPAPHKDLDLYHVAKKRFRFTSNKLDHVAQQLGVGAKVSHAGFGLWLECMNGDPKAWATMRRYNKGDVAITDGVYERLKGWIPNHPHVGLYVDTDEDVCGQCGSTDLRREGYALTNLGKYPRYSCRQCNGWSRGKTRVASVDARPVA